MKKNVTKALKKGNKNVSIQLVYQAQKLGSKFPVKDRTKPEHIHNVVSHAWCPNKKCKSHYNGQTRYRLGKRIIQHNKNSDNIVMQYNTIESTIVQEKENSMTS